MASLFAVLARHETPTSGRSMWWWSLQVMFKTNLMAPFCEDNHVEFCRIYYSNVKRGCRQTSKTWSVSVILVRRRVIVLRAPQKAVKHPYIQNQIIESFGSRLNISQPIHHFPPGCRWCSHCLGFHGFAVNPLG